MHDGLRPVTFVYVGYGLWTCGRQKLRLIFVSPAIRQTLRLHCLRQEGCVFVVVCLFVCLTISNLVGFSRGVMELWRF